MHLTKTQRLFLCVAVPALIAVAVPAAHAVFKLGFHGGDGRISTATGDWAPQQNKGECGGGHRLMVGVASATNGTFTDAILCHNSISGHDVDPMNGITLSGLRWGDNRRDTSTGDWAPNLIKGECAANEIMTGLAQTTNPNAALDRARCSPLLHPSARALTCSPQYFGASDSPAGGGIYGDWDPGYRKGTCPSGRAVKGVAMNNASGNANSVRSVLCCTYGVP